MAGTTKPQGVITGNTNIETLKMRSIKVSNKPNFYSTEQIQDALDTIMNTPTAFFDGRRTQKVALAKALKGHLQQRQQAQTER